MRSVNAYTANGANEMIEEIVAIIKTDFLAIMFRMDRGYFDEEIIETTESLGCKDLIKAKEYPPLKSQVTGPSVLYMTGEEGWDTAEFYETKHVG